MDYEGIAAKWLTEQTGTRFYQDVPANRPDSFGTVSLSSVSGDRFVTRPVLSVKCWATDRKKAASLAESAWEALFKADRLTNVFGVSMVGDYRDKDNASGMVRRNLTVQLTCCD